MRFLFLLCLLFAFTLPATAQEAPEAAAPIVIEWDRPTARVDGQPLSTDEIAGYQLGCSMQAGVYDAVDLVIPGGAAEEHETRRADILPGYGEYYCALRTVDTDGRAGPWSNEVQIAWNPAAPGAPSIRLIIN